MSTLLDAIVICRDLCAHETSHSNVQERMLHLSSNIPRNCGKSQKRSQFGASYAAALQRHMPIFCYHLRSLGITFGDERAHAMMHPAMSTETLLDRTKISTIRTRAAIICHSPGTGHWWSQLWGRHAIRPGSAVFPSDLFLFWKIEFLFLGVALTHNLSSIEAAEVIT